MKIKLLILFILLNLQSISLAEVSALYWDTNENDGDIYIGEVNDKNLHGIGTYYFSNGDILQGQFVNGNLTGHGQQQFSSGVSYRGYISNNRSNGYGVLYYKDYHFYGKHRNNSFRFEGNCGIEKFKDGRIDEFYCYENNKYKRLNISNIVKNSEARENAKSAEDARDLANINIKKANTIVYKYIAKWPHARLDKKTLCLRSTTLNGTWEKNNKFLDYVKEAKKRNLTEKICSSVTGRTIEKKPKKNWISISKDSETIGNDISKSCFLYICVDEEKVIPIWIGIFVLVIFFIFLIRKILSSNKKNDFTTDKIKKEEKQSFQVIQKEKSEKTEKEKVKNNVLKSGENEEKKEPIINNKSEVKTEKENEEIKKKTINKIILIDPKEIKTKVCRFCETENFGENLNCIICNKSLA